MVLFTVIVKVTETCVNQHFMYVFDFLLVVSSNHYLFNRLQCQPFRPTTGCLQIQLSVYRRLRCWYKQGVALMGCNRTGPLCSVGCRTGHAPGPGAADRRRKLQTTDDADRWQRAKQYWPVKRASNKSYILKRENFARRRHNLHTILVYYLLP